MSAKKTSSYDVPTTAALRDLILRMADSKRLLGLRYADWILGAPSLEAGIAASSMAQDEWGHGRLFYACVKELGEDPETVEHDRDASDYRNVPSVDAPFADWEELIVANLVVDGALSTILEAMATSTFKSLQGRSAKMLEEERYHFANAIGWFENLLMKPASKARLQTVLDRVWPDTLRWFGQDGADALLVKAGILDAGDAELRARFLKKILPRLGHDHLRHDDTVAFGAAWDALRRRNGKGVPDEETVARARGDFNKAYRLD